MPYWIKFNGHHINVLKLKKVEPWYKYRVYPENYAYSDVGKFENTNGCLRAIIEIGKRIDVPLLRMQRLLVRVLKTRFRPLFKVNPCSPRHLREMVGYVIKRRYKKMPGNLYFRGLLRFYSNFPSNRTIRLQFEEDKIFLGKDARIFFNMMQNQHIPEVYRKILEEATCGFGKVIIKDEEEHRKAEKVLKFLNLFAKIETS